MKFIIAFNLINGIDIPQTEARIAQYKIENAAIIEDNLRKEEQYAQYLKEHEEAERLEREQRAEELRKLEEAERLEREQGRQELIDKLETSDKDVKKLIARSRAEAAKRVAARTSSSLQRNTPGFLRSRPTRSTAIPDVPHVPIQDDWYAYEDKFTLRKDYDDPVSEAVRRDREGIMRAGGYTIEEAWERALRFAVAGLDLQPLQGLQSQISPADQDAAMASA